MGPGDYGDPDRGTSMTRRRGTVSGMLRIYLGHGAAGSAGTMGPWVDGLRARGYEAHALTLPRRKAEDAIAAFEAQVPDEPGVVIGGHSFGGRVASLSAAGVGRTGSEQRRRYAGLVCLSYPLHRPGHPETAEPRTAHWSRIAVPIAALLRDVGPVRAARPPRGRDAHAGAWTPRDVAEAGPRAAAGPRGRPRPDRHVPGGGWRRGRSGTEAVRLRTGRGRASDDALSRMGSAGGGPVPGLPSRPGTSS